MQKIIGLLDKKVKKLEVMVNRMLKSHDDKMEKIIHLLTGTRGGKLTGKEEERKLIEYSLSEEDEFY